MRDFACLFGSHEEVGLLEAQPRDGLMVDGIHLAHELVSVHNHSQHRIHTLIADPHGRKVRTSKILVRPMRQ